MRAPYAPTTPVAGPGNKTGAFENKTRKEKKMKLVRINAPDSILSIMAENVCAVEIRENLIKIYTACGAFDITAKNPEDSMAIYSEICRRLDSKWE